MNKNRERGKIDWMITLLPLTIIIALCILFFFAPEQSNAVLSQIRFFFGDTFGTYYLVIGLGIFILSLYIACSKYGDIVLGEPNEKPQYSFFAWGSMMFTCGLAADILFYSFSEWVLYATDPHLAEMGSIQDWAGVYPLFHWSFIPWGFYLVLAVAFGFMLHVRKRTRQKYSEACRPILGKHTDGWAGRIIDLLAVFALLAGTATTFSVATPLMATIIGELFHVAVSRTVINIIILLITCAVYTYSLLHGFKGISKLANVCIYLFFGLLAFVLLFGGETRYIIETGFSSLGRMMQNFIDLSTFTLNKSYELPIDLPTDIYLLDNISTITVSFDCSALETKTMNLPNTCVQVVNLPPTYQLTVQTERLMNVTLCGPKAAIASLTPEQVVIEIDAEDFSVATGEQNIACRLYVPSNGKIFALGSYVLQCRIDSN